LPLPALRSEFGCHAVLWAVFSAFSLSYASSQPLGRGCRHFWRTTAASSPGILGWSLFTAASRSLMESDFPAADSLSFSEPSRLPLALRQLGFRALDPASQRPNGLRPGLLSEWPPSARHRPTMAAVLVLALRMAAPASWAFGSGWVILPAPRGCRAYRDPSKSAPSWNRLPRTPVFVSPDLSIFSWRFSTTPSLAFLHNLVFPTYLIREARP